MAIAPGQLDLLRRFLATLATATGAAAAAVLNMWYDADIDAVMTRTARRPIPRGRISRPDALVLGLVLAGGAVAILALALNVEMAALLAFTIFFYVVVYTDIPEAADATTGTEGVITSSVQRDHCSEEGRPKPTANCGAFPLSIHWTRVECAYSNEERASALA